MTGRRHHGKRARTAHTRGCNVRECRDRARYAVNYRYSWNDDQNTPAYLPPELAYTAMVCGTHRHDFQIIFPDSRIVQYERIS
jgi:hypothetical protein